MVRGNRGVIGLGFALVAILGGLLGGGCGSSSSTSSPASTVRSKNDLSPTAAEREQRGKALLRPVGGGAASGFVLIGPGAGSGAGTMRFHAEGLKQANGKFVYSGWLVGAPGKMELLGSFEVGRDGVLNSTIEVGAGTLKQIADNTFDEVLVTTTNRDRVDPPSYTGTHVMRGTVTGPIVGSPPGSSVAKTEPRVDYAKAALHPVDGSHASGSATYRKEPSGVFVLNIDVKGLKPAHGEAQYAVWQGDSPKDQLLLATYHVGSKGRISEELEPSRMAPLSLEDGKATGFTITWVPSDDRLRASVVKAEKTEGVPDMGKQIVRGEFSGPLVGSGS